MLEPKELIRTHRTRWRCSEDFSRGLLKCTPFEPRHNMHRVSRHRSPPHTSCEVLYRGTTITARPFYFLPSVQNSLRLYVVCVCVYIFYPKKSHIEQCFIFNAGPRHESGLLLLLLYRALSALWIQSKNKTTKEKIVISYSA